LTELWEAAGITLFLLNFPDALRPYPLKNAPYALSQFLTFIGLCIAGYASSLFSVSIAPVIAVAGCVAFVLNVYLILKDTAASLLKTLCYVGATVYIAISVSSQAWFHLSNPLMLESIAAIPNPKLSADVLFHASIVQMMNTFGIPTTGLNGVAPINYHYGSHILFLQITNLLKIHPIAFYQMVYVILCIPFLFKSILCLVFEIRRQLNITSPPFDYRFLLILVIGFLGFTKFSFGTMAAKATAGQTILFISESYNLSMSFLFLLSAFLLNAYSKWSGQPKRYWSILLITPLWLFLIGLTKISTIYLAVAGLGYLYLRLGLFRKWHFTVTLLLCLLAFALACVLTIDQKTHEGSIQPFFFFKTILQSPLYIFFLIYFFFLIIFSVNLYLRYRLTRNTDQHTPAAKQFIAVEFLIVVALAGQLPGLVMSFIGLNSAYFSEVQHWLSIIFLLAYLPLFDLNSSSIASFIKKRWKYILIPLLIAPYFDHLIDNFLHVSTFLLFVPLFYISFLNRSTLFGSRAILLLVSTLVFIPVLNEVHDNWWWNLKRAFVLNHNVRVTLAKESNSANQTGASTFKAIDEVELLYRGLFNKDYSDGPADFFRKVKAVYNSQAYKSNKYLFFVQALRDMSNYSRQQKASTLVFVKNYPEIVQRFQCYPSAFLVPALTGFPALHGVPHSSMCILTGFSFEYFDPTPDDPAAFGPEKLLIAARQKGFSKVLVLEYNPVHLPRLRQEKLLSDEAQNLVRN
jgi:hypothetical protein